MEDLQKAKFLQDVVNGAAQIDYEDMLLSSRPAQNFGGPPVVGDESQEARDKALLLSKDTTVLKHLCPALKSASGDLESIAKAAGTVLFPLSLTPTAPVSMSALAIGALAVLVARAGVEALCPECGGIAKEQG
jgi:hypothetical protein